MSRAAVSAVSTADIRMASPPTRVNTVSMNAGPAARPTTPRKSMRPNCRSVSAISVDGSHTVGPVRPIAPRARPTRMHPAAGPREKEAPPGSGIVTMPSR